jgi:hypothetical protein
VNGNFVLKFYADKIIVSTGLALYGKTVHP